MTEKPTEFPIFPTKPFVKNFSVGQALMHYEGEMNWGVDGKKVNLNANSVFKVLSENMDEMSAVVHKFGEELREEENKKFETLKKFDPRAKNPQPNFATLILSSSHHPMYHDIDYMGYQSTTMLFPILFTDDKKRIVESEHNIKLSSLLLDSLANILVEKYEVNMDLLPEPGFISRNPLQYYALIDYSDDTEKGKIARSLPTVFGANALHFKSDGLDKLMLDDITSHKLSDYLVELNNARIKALNPPTSNISLPHIPAR